MRIVKEAKRVEMTRYYLSFRCVKYPGCGYAFDCDKDGNVILKNEASRQNYAMCVAGGGIDPVFPEGMKENHWSYVDPAEGVCDCGRRVMLDGFTNSCECGREYNHAGQVLAPRSQWGEETGEVF
jgi:hypothetical protein